MARTFRWAERADDDALGRVMYEAVRSGESRYGERQREAWVPAPRSGPEWTARLAGQDLILAEDGGEILGFMSLAARGYVDFAYIRPRDRRRGLFRQLYERIEALAVSRGHDLLSVHASLGAEPAFSAMGFAIVNEEEVEIGGERLRRFAMEKRL